MSVENSDTADLQHMHSGCPLGLGQPCHEHAGVVSHTRNKSDIGVSFKRMKPAQHHSPDPLPAPPLVWGATPPKWTSQHTNQCGRPHVVYAKRHTGARATLHISEATGADKTGHDCPNRACGVQYM